MMFPDLTKKEMEEIRRESVKHSAEQERLWPRRRALDAVFAERVAQEAKWGGSTHDDQHSSHDWIAYIAKHVGKAVVWPFDADTFRKQMIRVAALAVAAVEWADRNGGWIQAHDKVAALDPEERDRCDGELMPGEGVDETADAETEG